jgi:single-stranded DNA-binding protein
MTQEFAGPPAGVGASAATPLHTRRDTPAILQWRHGRRRSFSLAADVPSRNSASGEREFETRWYKVWTYGPLAEHVASSLVKGDRVTVRADDVTCRAWTDDSPESKPRARVELRAYDVAASMRFETLVTAKATRSGTAHTETEQAGGDPWADGGQVGAARDVPEVLAGITR